MDLSQKLHAYFKKSGVHKYWFAEKLGMKRPQFSLILSGKNTLPPKYWKKIIELTKGKVTLSDVIQNKLLGIEGIEFKVSKNPSLCKILLCDYDKNASFDE